MRGPTLFETALVLFHFRAATAQVSNVTCGPSYGWMLNNYQQNPCQVAAYLGGVCEAKSEFVIVPLGPGQYYPGPSLEQSNPCRCSSVLYSLLSACAVCQSRDFLSWSTYHHNCSTVYSGFTGDIPASTSVAAWAYQLNVTKADGFNVSAAEALAIGVPRSMSSFSTSSGSSMAPVSTNISSNTLSVDATGNSLGSRKISWAVIGVICFFSISIALVVVFKLWRRRYRPKSIAPSAAYRHRYAPIDLTSARNTLLEKDADDAGSVLDIRPASRSNSPISLSFSLVSFILSLQVISLLHNAKEPSEPVAYSPAAASSGVLSHGGHESDSDETVSLSHFVRLVPQRRTGGRS
ncbi:hypothetical protein C8R45DRAFT_976369 [Mycena sanguinolenta]|nr:hypothetical protein C8R45DRAFT_976369 [Mycena sanguinolenta]